MEILPAGLQPSTNCSPSESVTLFKKAADFERCWLQGYGTTFTLLTVYSLCHAFKFQRVFADNTSLHANYG